MTARLVLAIAALAACGKSPRDYDHEAAKGVFTDVVLHKVPDGLSGLAIDERVGLWAIAERDRRLVEITIPSLLEPPAAPKLRMYPLDGIPDGLDTEGIEWLGNGQIAIALEGQLTPRAALAFAERRGDRFVVTKIQALEQLELGVKLTMNHGAEGVCGIAGDLVVAIEATGRFPDGGRFAPIVRITGDSITVTRVRLSTGTGKIAGMECFIGTNGDARVQAIERHYGVSRIVKFVVPKTAAANAELAIEVSLDLAPILKDSLNLEGIVSLPDGRRVAVADNQGKSVSGPSRLLVFAPSLARK